MKALPKRKGNPRASGDTPHTEICLNESPSEKEGKSHAANANYVLPGTPQ